MYYADLDTLTKARLADAGTSRIVRPTPGWVSRWVKWVLERLGHQK